MNFMSFATFSFNVLLKFHNTSIIHIFKIFKILKNILKIFLKFTQIFKIFYLNFFKIQFFPNY